MKSVNGNLLTMAKAGNFDVIVHGCNCFCTMGNGIASFIKDEFPAAYQADMATRKGDRSKLGTFSHAEVFVNARKLIVVNGYTQFDYRGPGPNADYDAIRSVFKSIKENFSGARIGYPLIGAGLARGVWSKIEPIIDAELSDEDHTLVIFAPRS